MWSLLTIHVMGDTLVMALSKDTFRRVEVDLCVMFFDKIPWSNRATCAHEYNQVEWKAWGGMVQKAT